MASGLYFNWAGFSNTTRKKEGGERNRGEGREGEREVGRKGEREKERERK